MQFSVNTEYAPEYIREAAAKYAEMWQLDEALLKRGRMKNEFSFSCVPNAPYKLTSRSSFDEWFDGSTASEEAHQAQEMGKMILL